MMLSDLMFLLVAQSGGLSPWLILAIFLVIVFIVAWAMLRNTDESGADVEVHEGEHEAQEEVAEKVETLELEEETLEEVAEEEVESEPEPEPVTVEPDDLKKIEGIGPKVASLLNENGILTFSQLAETEVENLNVLLDANQLQMMDATSWPEQAKLAAAGDWEALQKLQDDLMGGR
jgi:predicted flap endonuclease-1-like 5' DNA nuclease